MATKLFLRSTAGNAIGNYYDMVTTAGSSAVEAIVNTAASGTQIQWTRTAGGTVLEFISGRVPSGGFTLSGTMSFSIWASENNMSANAGARARVFKRAANGTETEVGGGPYDDGVEFSTPNIAEMTWTGTPTSTAFAENDRIVVRYYITNVGTMAGDYTCRLTYDAADAATGDSFFQINENVTFKAEPVTHATSGALANTGAAVDGAASSFTIHATSGVLAGSGDWTYSAFESAYPTYDAIPNVAYGSVQSSIYGTASREEGGGAVTHATSGVLATSGAAVDGTSTNFTPHATTGVLANAGATVAGTATNFTPHATSGVLAASGATVDGTATNFTPHATSGVLANSGATIAGSATNFTAHATTGVLATAGATIAGASSNFTPHATSGVLATTGATVTGTSTRFRAYATSGVLTAAGATVTGSTERTGSATTHDTSGTLANAGSVVVGTAARFRAFISSGDIQASGATVTGSSARVGEAVTHETTGVLAGSGATVSAISTKTTPASGWFNWGSAPPTKKQIQQEREKLGILPKQVTRLKRAAKKAVETAQNPTEATQRAQEALIDSGVWDSTMQSILSLLIAFYADEFQRTLRINENKRLEQARILQEEEDIVFVAMLLAA
jgi:hypothetical protein